MTDSDWDSPRRTRAFLAAALAVAVGGSLYEARVASTDVPAWNSGIASVDVNPSRAATFQSAVAAARTAAVTVPAEGDRAFAYTDVALHDAVASPSLLNGPASPAMAARSAAFSSSAGSRVPGAFAPASAGGAHSAAESLASGARPAGTGSSRPADEGGGASGAQAPDDEESSSDPRAPSPVIVSRPGRSVAGVVTPAGRFFSGADLSGSVSVSQRAIRSGPAGAAAQDEDSSDPKKAAAKRPRRLKPALLSRLLGRRPLKAPKDAPAPPRQSPWTRPIPSEAATSAPLPFAAAELAAPPPDCGKIGPHWHAAGEVTWLHDGAVWGRSSADGWAWAEREKGRVWLFPDPKQPPLLRYEEHWWLRSRGLWFLLHDGAPWGAQYLKEWGAEGFVHPDGARMIYSADGSLVGMVEPDAGAVLYDSHSGDELGRWPPSALPKPRAPRVPKSLPAPR